MSPLGDQCSVSGPLRLPRVEPGRVPGPRAGLACLGEAERDIHKERWPGTDSEAGAGVGHSGCPRRRMAQQAGWPQGPVLVIGGLCSRPGSHRISPLTLEKALLPSGATQASSPPSPAPPPPKPPLFQLSQLPCLLHCDGLRAGRTENSVVTGWVRTQEIDRFSCCPHVPALLWTHGACLSKRKESLAHTHKKMPRMGVGGGQGSTARFLTLDV